MTKKKEKIQNITLAKMLKLEPGESVELSEEFLNELKPDIGKFAVIILTSNNKIIRIIPTVTNKVHKIGIDIGKLAPDFLRKVGNLFFELELKTLYSTGLCFVDEKCVFDVYIDSVEFEKIDAEKLKQEIMSVEGIADINISIIDVE
ncbi:MAG: hypothetical protein FK730_02240 [Asgard group archaeon]|nr:hypothetical protein [Asgard group archaeon]